MELTTNRLLIRPWQSMDRAQFVRINADEHVRRYYYPATLTQSQSDEIIDQCTDHMKAHGFAFLALEHRRSHSLIGGTGLSWTHDIPGGPRIEIGWILDRPFWRQGYALEAGQAWFTHGWSLGLEEIIGYTSAINMPSRALMNALGMTHDPQDDFADPTVPPDNPLSPHVLFYRQNPELGQ